MGIPVNNNQDTGDEGIDILSLKCKELGFSFREMPKKDVGIDGEIELRIGGKYNEKFQVQVKSSSKFKQLKNGEIKIEPLDRNHLEYWNDDINLPVFVVGVETSTGKVYWSDTRPYYEKIKKNKKQKTVQSYANSKKEITQENKTEFIKFLRELDIYNAKKTLIRNSPLDKLRIIGGEKGYKVLENRKQHTVELIHTKESKEHNINGNMLIEKRLSQNKFEVSNLSLNLGKDTIFKDFKGTMELFEVKDDIQISLSSKSHDYLINVEKYKEGDYTILQSKEGENIKFKSKLNSKTYDLSDSTTDLNMDFAKEDNIKDVFDFLGFLEETKDDFTLSFISKKGKKEPLLGGKMNNSKEIDIPFLKNFLSLLLEIEKKYNTSFSPQNIFDGRTSYQNMIDLIPYLKAIIEGTYVVNGKSNLSLTLQEVSQKGIINKEQHIRLQFPEYEVLGIHLPVDIYIDGTGIIKNPEGKKYKIETNQLIFHTKVSGKKPPSNT